MKDFLAPLVRFVAGAVLCGFAATVLLPAVDPAARSAAAAPLGPAQARGRWVYAREGCVACHTQQVRAPEARFGMVEKQGDVGEASAPAHLTGQNPVLTGSLRAGPDLARLGARTPQADRLRSLLKSGGVGMPRYGYLSEAEISDLVAYLLTLR